MSDSPATIKYPETFKRSPSAGFDGVFDWSWTQGCFGGGKITPMDFDGVIERNGNFLVMETKAVGKDIPKGQMITLESAYALGCFTLLFIQGKGSPEYGMYWCQPGFKAGKKMPRHSACTAVQAHEFCAEWFAYACANPRGSIDVSFLNKKIEDLGSQIDEKTRLLDDLKSISARIVSLLGGEVDWHV
jgi:hypothetical protein